MTRLMMEPTTAFNSYNYRQLTVVGILRMP